MVIFKLYYFFLYEYFCILDWKIVYYFNFFQKDLDNLVEIWYMYIIFGGKGMYGGNILIMFYIFFELYNK